MGWCEMGSSDSEQKRAVGSCEHGNEHLVSIKQGPHISQKSGTYFQTLGNMKKVP